MRIVDLDPALRAIHDDIAESRITLAEGLKRAKLCNETTAKDYLSVLQIAIGVGHDGQLDHREHIAGPDHALIPTYAAGTYFMMALGQKVSQKLGLDDAKLEAACKPIRRGMIKQDIEKDYNAAAGETKASARGGPIVLPTAAQTKSIARKAGRA
jgi:hypothetical protein